MLAELYLRDFTAFTALGMSAAANEANSNTGNDDGLFGDIVLFIGCFLNF